MLFFPLGKRSLASVLGVVLVCLAEPKVDADAAAPTSIVLAVEYTSEGRANEDGATAIEGYLQFVLSRMPYGRAQRIGDYNRDCNSRDQGAKADSACRLPDFVIQVQIAESQGDLFQISGVVSRNVEF